MNPNYAGSSMDKRTTPSIVYPFRSTEASGSAPVVFVVSPDGRVCELLKGLIECEECSETFASAEEFLSHPQASVPSCLFVDAGLSGLGGLELQERIRIERPHMSVIFFSAEEDIPKAVRAMKAGAIEFFMMPLSDDKVMAAIREALQRSRLVLARETEKRTLCMRYALLSGRERQVMALVSAGLINKRVGEHLGISEITVKAHRGQVMQKMHASSLVDLVKMARKLAISRRMEFPVSFGEVSPGGFQSAGAAQ